jgi:hypothetical protein
MSLCFHSSNLSILTPIQESLVSFLFPFVWQGVYIPVLDHNLLDVLDAPVPIIVGFHSKYLPPPNKRNANIVFVDIDNDSLSFGGEIVAIGSDQSLLLAELPIISKTDYSKLKSKLDEFGGIIYRTLNLNSAGNPFPSNEKVPRPIPSTALTDAGRSIIAQKSQYSNLSRNTAEKFAVEFCTRVFTRDFHENADSDSINPQAIKDYGSSARDTISSMFSFGRDLINKDSDKLSDKSSNHSLGFNSIRKGVKYSVLDPINNSNFDDLFDSRELRKAFLRFFVSSLLHYQDFITSGGFDKEKFISKDSEPIICAM